MVLGKVVLVEQGLLACWIFLEIEVSGSSIYVLWIYKEGGNGMFTCCLCLMIPAQHRHKSFLKQWYFLFGLGKFHAFMFLFRAVHIDHIHQLPPPFLQYFQCPHQTPPLSQLHVLLLLLITSCVYLIPTCVEGHPQGQGETYQGSHLQRRVNLLPSTALEMRLWPLPHPCGIVTGLIMRR